MTTASAKGKGSTTFDIWRQTNAILQGRKFKPPVTRADRYVLNRGLRDFVHRTTATGSVFVTDLKTGEQVKLSLFSKNGGRTIQSYELVDVDRKKVVVNSRNHLLLAGDVDIQKKLIEMFALVFPTLEEVLYCKEHPEFLEKLTRISKGGSHYDSDVIEKCINDPKELGIRVNDEILKRRELQELYDSLK